MSGIKYGLLHCHTDNSIRDSVMTVKDLVFQAKRLGAPAVALTDHGVMTGYMEFMQLCREEGMNPIVGVEAYVEEETEGCRHLIIMAKDYTGFQALIQAVSESNNRIKKISGTAYPRMNKEMLKKHFGPDGKGHGHVIATSACSNGVLAALLTTKIETERQIEKLKKKQKDYESPEYIGFQKNIELLNGMKLKQSRLRTEISQYANENLEEERKAVEHEIERLEPIVQQERASMAKWNLIQSQIDEAAKKNMTDKELDEILSQEANWYRDNFGRDHFYIELQYHGMREEKKAMVKLAELSDLTGIPVCISNNAHI